MNETCGLFLVEAQFSSNNFMRTRILHGCGTKLKSAFQGLKARERVYILIAQLQCVCC